jgi:hypothetical protein
MTTAEFLARLEQHRDHRLAFGAGGSSVAPGYHVTEIKAATIHAVDCGGRSTAWNETTLQLSSPEGSDGAELMGVAKFLSIYDRVGTMAPIDAQARLRVEYGPPGEVAVSYVVTDVVRETTGCSTSVSPPRPSPARGATDPASALQVAAIRGDDVLEEMQR